MTNQLKVLQVVSSLGMGGAETWLLELVRYWKENKVHIQNDFLITSGEKGVFDQRFSEYGCGIHYYKIGKNDFFPFIKKYRSLLKKERYAAIHSHEDILSGWYFALGAGHLPAVCVTHFHNPAYQWKYNYGVSARRRFQLKAGKGLIKRFSTHIRGTSNELLREAEVLIPEFQRQAPASLHCAIDLRKWRAENPGLRAKYLAEMGWPADSRVVLFAGRFDYSIEINHPQNHKNSAFALNVFADAARKDSRLRMLMAGANDYIKTQFLELVKSKGMEDRVALLGIRQDLPSLMKSSDVLLFPSRSEGLGMVAVEAQAAGLAVIASTGVPKECVVIPEMVSFLDLKQPIAEWAEGLMRVIAAGKSPGGKDRPEWEVSPFNLKNSAQALFDLYSGVGEAK